MARAAVIFDFDGTLADSLADVVAVYNQLAPGLGLRAVSAVDVDRLRGMSPQEALETFQIPLWKVPQVLMHVRTALRGCVHRLKPFPGMVEAVSALHGADYRCGILSSNSSDNIREFLRRHRMEDFALVCTASNVFGKAKPLRKLVRRAHWPAADVFYVGDEVRDVRAAREAGVRSVAVTWGYSARRTLADEHPEFLVDTPEELVEMLGGASHGPSEVGVNAHPRESGS